MAKPMVEVGTLTMDNVEQRTSDIHRKCELLNVIQHIDIYGKSRSNYAENWKKNGNETMAVSSVSCFSPKFSKPRNKLGLSDKISKFSVSTKVSGLYPGNDILTRKNQQQKLCKFSTRSNLTCGCNRAPKGMV